MPRRRKKHLPAMITGILAVFFVAVGVVACHRLTLTETPAKPAVDEHRVFIKRIAPYAQEMQRQYSVLASITLAQAILESDWGQSTLASEYHNLFGVKGTDPNTSRELATKEYVNGKWITVKARFRVYANDEASVKDHALLLVYGTKWNAHLYDPVRQATDYQTAAKALQTAGYATDPTYANKLIQIIETYNLTQYDQ
ncbi:glycoside hydrolase family 73 protein [Lacticaseibacillus suibinensis]|uniref:glycoside hydrolase family 73 protein n=1 Tax=Lacticaseibacillus suibinensis TaxID=2486011 RepID=UPI0019426C9B|nr:glycoside hydrolase family 73 protein [Lacticaseibacillus suibinensis]